LSGALRALERAASGWPWLGFKLRQVFTRLAPIHHTNVRGLSIRAILPLHQVGTFAEFQAWGSREPEVLDWIDSFKPPFCFLDVGSNFGTESLYAAKRHPKGTVVACDPEFLGGYNLAVNILLNGLENIDNYAVALGSAPGWLPIPENLNYLNVMPGRKYASARRLVRMESIDSLLDGQSVEYLKIDVDGLEQEILRGARKTLASKRLRSLIVEVDEPEARAEVIGFLKESGYDLTSVSGASGNNHRFDRRFDRQAG
jgi:FkbM family methyltransferase